MSLKRLLPALLVAFLAIYVVTAVLSGSASFVLAVVLVVLLFVAGLGAALAAQRSVAKRHDGDPRAAMDDHTEPIPAAPFITDDETDLGDTTEAHDEITPHDLPIDHPGRRRAEELAGHPAATTRGDLGA